MSSVGKPGSVVTRKYDESVFVETVGADGVENLSDGPIDFRNHIPV